MVTAQALRFVAALTPDLIATGHALYRVFSGDLKRARTVLQIVRDHGVRLEEAREVLDQELAALRADRAAEQP